MAQQPPDRMVMALPPRAYEFLGVLIARALEAGLVVPDELSATNMVWTCYRTAAPVTAPPPTESADASSEAAAPQEQPC